MNGGTTDPIISNLAAAEEISEHHAKQIGHDFEQWLQTNHPGGPAGAAKIKHGFGFGTLLKIGALLISVFKAIASAVSARAVIESVPVAGFKFGVVAFDETAVDPAAGLTVTDGGYTVTIKKNV